MSDFRTPRTVGFDTSAPLVIGGVGGSGTRLVAEIARQLGVYIGADLNGANDNLWFTLLLKRPSTRADADKASVALDLLTKAMTSNAELTRSERRFARDAVRETPRPHERKWLRQRARTLRHHDLPDPGRYIGWGWKEPNSHVFLDDLDAHYPGLRYIHVMRNGLDMALSGNQNQMRTWQGFFQIPSTGKTPTPAAALHYWCLANARAAGFAESLGSRFLMVNFDDLCLDPERELPALCSFVAGADGLGRVDDLRGLVTPPDSIGRYREIGRAAFDPADVAVVESLGFRVG